MLQLNFGLGLVFSLTYSAASTRPYPARDLTFKVPQVELDGNNEGSSSAATQSNTTLPDNKATKSVFWWHSAALRARGKTSGSSRPLVVSRVRKQALMSNNYGAQKPILAETGLPSFHNAGALVSVKMDIQSESKVSAHGKVLQQTTYLEPESRMLLCPNFKTGTIRTLPGAVHESSIQPNIMMASSLATV